MYHQQFIPQNSLEENQKNLQSAYFYPNSESLKRKPLETLKMPSKEVKRSKQRGEVLERFIKDNQELEKEN